MADSIQKGTTLTQNGSEIQAIINQMPSIIEKVNRLAEEWQQIKDANFTVQINPHIEKVEMGGVTAATIAPDKFYIFGEVPTLALGFEPGDDAYVHQYFFQFQSPADKPTSLSLPLGIKFPSESDNVLQIKTSRIYQISVFNNLAIATSWEV